MRHSFVDIYNTFLIKNVFSIGENRGQIRFDDCNLIFRHANPLGPVLLLKCHGWGRISIQLTYRSNGWCHLESEWNVTLKVCQMTLC